MKLLDVSNLSTVLTIADKKFLSAILMTPTTTLTKTKTERNSIHDMEGE